MFLLAFLLGRVNWVGKKDESKQNLDWESKKWEKLILLDEESVHVSGIEKSNVIGDSGEFLLIMQGSWGTRQEFVQVKKACGFLGYLWSSSGSH